MKVLITGGSGFVAPYAAIELEAHGHTPVLSTLSRSEVAWAGRRWPAIRCDLRRRSSVEKLVRAVRPDAVLHLAGQSHPLADMPPSAWFEMNVIPTIELARAVKNQDKDIVFVLSSTVFVYEQSRRRHMVLDETSPVGPWTRYGFSKLAAEQVVWAHADKKFHGYVARSFNHIGPGQTEAFVCAALAGRVARAHDGDAIPVGNLSAVRDFSDVRDIVRAYRLMMERRPSQTLFVLGSGRGVSIQHVLDRFIYFSGKSVRVKTERALLRKNDPATFVAKPTLAQRYLGWRCRVPLDQTLEEIYARAQTNAN